jgi:hypothetical protein
MPLRMDSGHNYFDFLCCTELELSPPNTTTLQVAPVADDHVL